mgnify:CR=1 FL=1
MRNEAVETIKVAKALGILAWRGCIKRGISGRRTWCQDICFSMGITGTCLDDYEDRWGDGCEGSGEGY